MKQFELPNMPTAAHHQLNLDMCYQRASSNIETGRRRIESSIKYCARFGLISPTFVSWLYNISRANALEHLNKLVNADLLQLINTFRATDNRVYVLTHSGARFAEQLLAQHVPFRSASDPATQINQNTLMHDLIVQFICARGIHNHDATHQLKPLWHGFVTESEFRRIYPATNIRNVDALVIEHDGTICAIEIEHSFKTIELRKTILLKYLHSLKAGIYDKIFLVSQSFGILDDMRRINQIALNGLQSSINKKTNRAWINESERKLLEEKLIYRSKFCDEITRHFYQ